MQKLKILAAKQVVANSEFSETEIVNSDLPFELKELIMLIYNIAWALPITILYSNYCDYCDNLKKKYPFTLDRSKFQYFCIDPEPFSNKRPLWYRKTRKLYKIKQVPAVIFQGQVHQGAEAFNLLWKFMPI